MNLGGLSSFCLFNLILATAKMHRFTTGGNASSYGKILVEFLLYYGSYLNFSYTLIDVNCEK